MNRGLKMERPSEDELIESLVKFIRERFLDGDPQGELDADSPLLEWGVLNSLNSAVLLNHIHLTLVPSVPLERIDARSFSSVRNIARMLDGSEAER